MKNQNESNNQNVVDNVVDNVVESVVETNEDKISNLLKQSPSLSAAKLGKLIGLGDRQIQRITQKTLKRWYSYQSWIRQERILENFK